MGRVLATSDWHGCDFYQDILNTLAPDDTIYFLGDAIDRGDANIDTFNALYNDKRVTFIKGNHEDMLVAFLTIEGLIQKEKETILWNGTDKTLKEIAAIPAEKRPDFVKIITQMPEQLIYNSPRGHYVILEHAGFSPFAMPLYTHDPVWDRMHFRTKWDEGFNYRNKALTPNNTYVVHGHTPVQVLRFEYGYIDKEPLLLSEMEAKSNWYAESEHPYKPHIINYCNNHKFDIDMGTAFSKRVAFLDLDTFEEFYFDKETMKLTK